tara:strand:- start:473 stop:868 length:396 start_codon:yes stop_codon:yes gene_type:complete
MTQEKKAYIDTLLDGGYTHLWDSTINPTEGYIVGGLTEATTMYAEVDGSAYPDTRAHFKAFKKLWDKYYTLLDDKFARLMMGCGIGTWVHEGQIYFDIVQHINELDIATKIAKRRGEIAIYDCKNQKEILL